MNERIVNVLFQFNLTFTSFAITRKIDHNEPILIESSKIRRKTSSAYEAELYAILRAITKFQDQNLVIYSDCKSAIKSISKIALKLPPGSCRDQQDGDQRDGDARVRQDTAVGLEAAKGFIRREIGKAVRLREETLARELAPKVRVNAVAPGLVETSFSRALLDDPDVRKLALADVPLGRPAAPAEIVDGVLFLSCDASRYVTGEVLVIDGGKIV